jgi:uncharacterized membrane protein YbhN (UPF0104 family)
MNMKADSVRAKPRFGLGLPSYLWTLLRVLVSISLLGAIVLRVDWSQTLHAMAKVPWSMHLLGAGLFLLAQAITSRRLQMLLKVQGVGIGYVFSLRLTLLGLFAGNFLPSTVGGDAIKALRLVRIGARPGASLLSLVMDRLINFVAAACLCPLILFVPNLIDQQRIQSVASAAVMPVLVGSAVAALVVPLSCYAWRRRLGVLRTPQSGIVARAGARMASLRASRIGNRPPLGVVLVGLALSWLALWSSIFAAWLASQCLGVTLHMIPLASAIVVTYFVGLLPVTLNGLGLQEASLVYLLSRLGVGGAEALALSALIRAYSIAPSFFGLFDAVSWVGTGESGSRRSLHPSVVIDETIQYSDTGSAAN